MSVSPRSNVTARLTVRLKSHSAAVVRTTIDSPGAIVSNSLMMAICLME